MWRMMRYMVRHKMKEGESAEERPRCAATVRGHGARPIWRQRQRCPCVARREDIIVSTHVTSAWPRDVPICCMSLSAAQRRGFREALNMHLESAAAVTRDGGDTRRRGLHGGQDCRSSNPARRRVTTRTSTHALFSFRIDEVSKKFHSQCTRGSIFKRCTTTTTLTLIHPCGAMPLARPPAPSNIFCVVFWYVPVVRVHGSCVDSSPPLFWSFLSKH